MAGDPDLPVAVFVGGEGTGFHVLAVVGKGRGHLVAEIGVPFDEAGSLAVRESEHVMRYEDLAVAVGAGADADGGDVDRPGDQGADLSRDTFDNEGKGASLFHGKGILQKLFNGGMGFPLDLVATGLEDALRGEADMGENRDAVFGEAADGVGPELAALQFNPVGSGFPDEAGGVHEGAFG